MDTAQRLLASCVLALGFVTGCSDDDGVDPIPDATADASAPDGSTPDGSAPDGSAPDAGLPDATTPDAPTPDGGGGDLIELLAGEWSLGGTDEGYVCVRRTMTETVYIREFLPIAPLGTHHTVLTIDERSGTPDGTVRCNALANGPEMIYGSGVGTTALQMPPGVAIKVEAGQQVLLNLHIFNSAPEPLTGRSGIMVRTMPAADVEFEAEVLLAGNEFFRIPARTRGHEVNGRCTMPADTTIFAVMPHMHQFGTFMSVEVNGTILHEDFYSFDDQTYTTFEPMAVAAGSRVNVLCRYDNDTDSMVFYGDSTLSEMCYAAVYRYPAIRRGGVSCTD